MKIDIIVARYNENLEWTKEFYEKIVKMLENNSDPIEGYVIERFHKLIFNSLNHDINSF